METPQKPTKSRAKPATGAPSIADVAKVAGVSAQTVSRVSTGYQGVRPATRERVLNAMRTVGYVPNSAARALKHGSFRTIGVVAHQLARTGESSTIEAVVDSAQRQGFGVSLVDISSPTSADVSAAAAGLASRAIDGLVIIRAESIEADALALPPQVPVVVSDSRFADNYPAVATDQRAGAIGAVKHLLRLGHRSVTHISGPSQSLPARERHEGWEHALQESGIAVPEPLVGGWDARSGYDHGQALLDKIKAREVTAVFCANDQVALGFYRAVYEAGCRIPDDVSVIGFDDIPEAAFYAPPLTSVAQDFHQIGERLVSMLIEQIGSNSPHNEHILLPVELVERASTAPPPGAK